MIARVLFDMCDTTPLEKLELEKLVITEEGVEEVKWPSVHPQALQSTRSMRALAACGVNLHYVLHF